MSEAEEIQRAFKVCDKDEDGALTKQELIMYLCGLGLMLDKATMDSLPEGADFNTAKGLYTKIRSTGDPIPYEDIKAVFRTWDASNSGKVSLSTILKPVGDSDDICPYPSEQMDFFKSIAEISGDSFSYDSFARMMSKTQAPHLGTTM